MDGDRNGDGVDDDDDDDDDGDAENYDSNSDGDDNDDDADGDDAHETPNIDAVSSADNGDADRDGDGSGDDGGGDDDGDDEGDDHNDYDDNDVDDDDIDNDDNDLDDDGDNVMTLMPRIKTSLIHFELRTITNLEPSLPMNPARCCLWPRDLVSTNREACLMSTHARSLGPRTQRGPGTACWTLLANCEAKTRKL